MKKLDGEIKALEARIKDLEGQKVEPVDLSAILTRLDKLEANRPLSIQEIAKGLRDMGWAPRRA